jgi:RES domain-containing protein
VRLWRLSPLSPAALAFDGEGARLYPGRWNHEGVPMVYTSAHLSLAALELFVHLEPHHLRRATYAYSAEVGDDDTEVLPRGLLQPGWDALEPPGETRELGSRWARSGRSLALVVPSAVVPQESNILLNPAHPAFASLAVQGPETFWFDPRLAVRR